MPTLHLAFVTLALFACIQTAPAQTDADALRGPKVDVAKTAPSLVKRDMAGKLERLEVRPEEAAIDLLRLTPEQRAAADKVITDRAARVSTLLADHRALFLEIQNARQSGTPRDEVVDKMRELATYAKPLLDPPLLTNITAALPENKRVEYQKLVADYIVAFTADEPGNNRPRANPDAPSKQPLDDPAMQPAPAARRAVAVPQSRTEFNFLLREMARTLNGIVQERKDRMDTLLKAIDATPEQAEQIQKITRAGGENAGPHPTADQRREVRRKIRALLTPEQQKKMDELDRPK